MSVLRWVKLESKTDRQLMNDYDHYIYRHHLIDNFKTIADVEEAIDSYERVAGTILGWGSFEQHTAKVIEEAVYHIADFSGLFDDPERILATGGLKNNDELKIAIDLVDKLKAALDNVYFEEPYFPEEWPTVVEAAQAALDIFDPYFPYTQDTIPDEARQFGAEQPHPPVDMNDEGWIKSDLGFRDTELRQNRELGFSDAQKMRFKKRYDSQTWCAMIAAGFVVVPLLLMWFMIGLLVDSVRSAVGIPLLIMGIALGVVMWVGIRASIKLANLTVTKAIGVVGDPDPNWGPYWQPAMLSLTAEGQPIQMKVPTRYFTKGDRYRLYYVYETKTVLSAEKISDGE